MTTAEKIQQHLTTCDIRRTRRGDTARALCISETTMRRHLRFEGTNYQALLEAEKRRRNRKASKSARKARRVQRRN